MLMTMESGKIPEIGGFVKANVEAFARDVTALGVRGNFICESCRRPDGRPKSWQSKNEAASHQQKTGHRILLNPRAPIEEQPRVGGNGELDVAGMKLE